MLICTSLVLGWEHSLAKIRNQLRFWHSWFRTDRAFHAEAKGRPQDLWKGPGNSKYSLHNPSWRTNVSGAEHEDSLPINQALDSLHLSNVKALFKVTMTHAVGFLGCFNIAGALTNHKKAGVRSIPPMCLVHWFRVVPSLDPDSQIRAGSLLPSDKMHLVPAMESNQGGQSRER